MRVQSFLDNSTLIPPAGISLSEDVDTTYSFIFTEYDQNLRLLRGCYEGSKPPKEVGQILEFASLIAAKSLRGDAARLTLSLVRPPGAAAVLCSPREPLEPRPPPPRSVAVWCPQPLGRAASLGPRTQLTRFSQIFTVVYGADDFVEIPEFRSILEIISVIISRFSGKYIQTISSDPGSTTDATKSRK